MTSNDDDDATGLVELGTISGDTKGPFGLQWERVGMSLNPGLTDE
ncbi:MAG TPA: hypothetical protein VF631_07470 [Allosphingosinicella sp.]|jgi:hypothetical protein